MVCHMDSGTINVNAWAVGADGAIEARSFLLVQKESQQKWQKRVKFTSQSN